MAAWRSTMPLKTPRFEPPSCQLGEEALDCVEPGGGGWGEMEMKALVPFEPGANPRFREGRLLGCLCVA